MSLNFCWVTNLDCICLSGGRLHTKSCLPILYFKDGHDSCLCREIKENNLFLALILLFSILCIYLCTNIGISSSCLKWIAHFTYCALAFRVCKAVFPVNKTKSEDVLQLLVWYISPNGKSLDVWDGIGLTWSKPLKCVDKMWQSGPLTATVTYHLFVCRISQIFFWHKFQLLTTISVLPRILVFVTLIFH